MVYYIRCLGKWRTEEKKKDLGDASVVLGYMRREAASFLSLLGGVRARGERERGGNVRNISTVSRLSQA